MTARHPRSAFVAAMLAFMALFVVSGLSGWHAAAFHDDEPAHAMSFEHVHRAGGAARDTDGAIHLAAHAVAQGIAIPADAAAPRAYPLVALAWPVGLSLFRAGFRPASLLRPPRG